MAIVQRVSSEDGRKPPGGRFIPPPVPVPPIIGLRDRSLAKNNKYFVKLIVLS